MTTLQEFNDYGKELEQLLTLKTSPIAVKLLEKEADIPKEAIRPKRDLGVHLAQCQAFAMSRRDGATVAMLKEDSWCFAPLIAYGLVDVPTKKEVQMFVNFPKLERGKYIGIVSAPLKSATFIPDVVHIYTDNSQLRTLLMPSHYIGREDRVNYHFFPPDCAYTVVPVLETGKYMIAIPDPGNYMRALAGDGEIIFAVRGDKLRGVVEGQRGLEERKAGHSSYHMMMHGDFDRPDFYKELFKDWGLQAEP